MKKLVSFFVVLVSAQLAFAFPSGSITCGGIQTVGSEPAEAIQLKFDFNENLVTASFPGTERENEDLPISELVSDLNKVANEHPECASVSNFTPISSGDFKYYKFGAEIKCGSSELHFKLETYCQ